jgi:hypothetical protein
MRLTNRKTNRLKSFKIKPLAITRFSKYFN